MQGCWEMAPGPSPDQVRAFLTEFKRAATENTKKIAIVSREKNWNALTDLGLTERKRDDAILALTPYDYSMGPELDEDPQRGGFVWVFGAEIHGQQAYIKLKLVEDGPLRHAICVSFHRAEWTMHFPFRK